MTASSDSSSSSSDDENSSIPIEERVYKGWRCSWRDPHTNPEIPNAEKIRKKLAKKRANFPTVHGQVATRHMDVTEDMKELYELKKTCKQTRRAESCRAHKQRRLDAQCVDAGGA